MASLAEWGSALKASIKELRFVPPEEAVKRENYEQFAQTALKVQRTIEVGVKNNPESDVIPSLKNSLAREGHKGTENMKTMDIVNAITEQLQASGVSLGDNASLNDLISARGQARQIVSAQGKSGRS